LFFVLGNRGWVLRIGAVAYLVNAILSLINGGVSWVGWLMLALGFLALSFAEDASQPGIFKWRSPAWCIGVVASVLGIGILLYALSHALGKKP
jgi:hypothetical protein